MAPETDTLYPKEEKSCKINEDELEEVPRDNKCKRLSDILDGGLTDSKHIIGRSVKTRKSRLENLCDKIEISRWDHAEEKDEADIVELHPPRISITELK